MPDWTWDEDAQVYRDDNGDPVPWAIVLGLLWGLIATAEEAVMFLVDLSQSSLSQWESQFRDILMQLYIQSYILGRGDVNLVTPEQYTLIEELLDEQYQFLRRLRDAIESGASPQQIAYRSRLFLRSADQAFWYGRQRGWRVEFPAHPGDCSTVCCTNCHCYWRVDDSPTDGTILAFWEIMPSVENCPDCIERNKTWYPIVLPIIEERG